MRRKRILFFVIILKLFFFVGGAIAQQQIRIEGYVKDSLTQEDLSYASVSIKGTTIGTTTDEKGYFTFLAPRGSDSLMVATLGYYPYVMKLNPARGSKLLISLVPTSYQLKEAVVKPGKEKYTRKDNPAVAFIKSVIDARERDNPHNMPYYSYEQYEDMEIALNDYVEAKPGSWLNKQLGSLSSFVDTSAISGRAILPVSQKEIVENVYFRKSPQRERRVVKGIKNAGIDEILSEEGVKQFLDEVFKEIDLFQNDIPLFLQRFVSPISTIGPLFYKYYLMDTVVVKGEECVDLGFVPFNSESFGFTGHLYFTNDSARFLKKAVLNVPKDINLNFVERMMITQEYERTSEGLRVPTKDDIAVEFKLTAKSRGLYARRIIAYRDHSFDPPADEKLFDGIPRIELADARQKPDLFWNENRVREEKPEQNSVEALMARLRSVPFFYWTEKVVSVLVSGYIHTSGTSPGPVEIGPMNTLISGNTVEGMRLRAGGATSPEFSKRLSLEGYVAYGTRDQKLKYDALAEYSFIDRKKFRKEFPVHSIRAEYSYDVNQLGQQYLYTNADNIFLLLKRKENNLMTYLRKAELVYQREHYNGWSYAATLRHQNEEGTEYVSFKQLQPDGSILPVKDYTSAELELKLRWAPHEKFYQTRNYRYPITFDAPIITLNHVIARKGILGSDFSFNRTDLSINKRFWLSAFGYIDFVGKAGKVWDPVPFPMLIIPNANLSYTIQLESYALLNPMEFINDQYASWDFTYYMNGLVLNRIPLLKKLQWREVVTFKGFYGDLSDKNDPTKGHAGLFLFPESTYEMGSKPYMELGFGVTNILKVLRFDYIWRLSYRDHPDASNGGLRVRIEFSF